MALDINKVEWLVEARRRYGHGPDSWEFRCPMCKQVFRAGQWRASPENGGAIPEREAANRCLNPQCGYHGTAGFFNMNPIVVHHPDLPGNPEQPIWDFAEEPLCP